MKERSRHLTKNHHRRMHLYSHIFHSIYFNGTKRHDETEKNRYSVGAQHFVLLCVFLPFLKSASISMERRRKKSTPNRIVISSNGRLYVQRGESESYKTQWSVIKLFIFIFSFSFLLFSFFLLVACRSTSFTFPSFFHKKNHIWCVCKCDLTRLYCDAFVSFFLFLETFKFN